MFSVLVDFYETHQILINNITFIIGSILYIQFVIYVHRVMVIVPNGEYDPWNELFTTDDEDDNKEINKEIIEDKGTSQLVVPNPIAVKAYPWKYSVDLSPSLTLEGHSRSAEKTCFFCPQLSTYFDAGIQSLKPPQLILLTHGHLDHSGDIAKMNLEFGKKVTVMVPKEILNEVKNSIDSHYKMNNRYDKQTTLDNKYNIVPVEPYVRYLTKINGRDYLVETYKCYHGVPCVGYGLYENRNKLKDEFKELTGKEIGKLRKEGTVVNELVSVPLIAYIGDTTIKFFQDEKNMTVFQFPFIVIECTFFLDDNVDKAIPNGHIHWKHLCPIIQENPDNTFILIHFSTRHRDNEIHDFFESEKNRLRTDESNVDNIIVWLG